MNIMAAQAPEEIDFGIEEETKEVAPEGAVDVVVNPLDAKALREQAKAARKAKTERKDPEKVYPQELIQNYVDELATYVQWSASEGEMEFEWDCSKLERGLIEAISTHFKVEHGHGMMVIKSSHSIKVNWSGKYEV